MAILMWGPVGRGGLVGRGGAEPIETGCGRGLVGRGGAEPIETGPGRGRGGAGLGARPVGGAGEGAPFSIPAGPSPSATTGTPC